MTALYFLLSQLRSLVVDGSNTLLSGLRVGGKPSVRAFCALLAMLDQAGVQFRVWFDNSVYPHLQNAGMDVYELKALIAELNRHGLLNMAPRADMGIHADCLRLNAGVVNGTDRNDSWPAPVPDIYRARLSVAAGGELIVSISAAGSGRRLASHSVSDAFQFRGLSFPALPHARNPPDLGHAWAARPKFRGRRAPGSLIVLALDASPSMDIRDTFDGRSRAAHVNDLVRATVVDLSKSAIASNCLLSVVAFSSEVQVLSPDGSGLIFSPLRAWQGAPGFNYVDAVKRNGTNIRLTLDQCNDQIDGFRQSDVAGELAMSWKNATVIMATDGEHCTEIDGRLETSKDILAHVFATINRSDDVSFGFVGLGDEADHQSLLSWSSPATPQQISLAARKNVPLQDGKLYVPIASQDANLGNIIRSFVDLASSRAV